MFNRQYGDPCTITLIHYLYLVSYYTNTSMLKSSLYNVLVKALKNILFKE